jgi:hypothetical protein
VQIAGEAESLLLRPLQAYVAAEYMCRRMLIYADVCKLQAALTEAVSLIQEHTTRAWEELERLRQRMLRESCDASAAAAVREARRAQVSASLAALLVRACLDMSVSLHSDIRLTCARRVSASLAALLGRACLYV